MSIDVNEWRDVKGCSKYEVNPLGEIRYKRTKRLLKPKVKKTGKQRGNSLQVTLYSDNGKRLYKKVLRIVAEAYFKIPEGKVPYHKNGNQDENDIWNVGFATVQELGKMTGAKSGVRKPVIKFNKFGTQVDIYSSAREAARNSNCSYQVVSDHANGRVKNLLGGEVTFAWEDDYISMKKAIERCRKNNG